MVATRPLQPGDLLLCVPPVAFLAAAPGQPRAEGEQLIDLIVERRLFRRPWFNALYDGTSASCAQTPDLLMPPDGPDLPQPPTGAPAGEGGGGTGGAQGPPPPAGQPPEAAAAGAPKPSAGAPAAASGGGFKAGPKSKIAKKGAKQKKKQQQQQQQQQQEGAAEASLDRRELRRIAKATMLNCYGERVRFCCCGFRGPP